MVLGLYAAVAVAERIKLEKPRSFVFGYEGMSISCSSVTFPARNRIGDTVETETGSTNEGMTALGAQIMKPDSSKSRFESAAEVHLSRRPSVRTVWEAWKRYLTSDISWHGEAIGVDFYPVVAELNAGDEPEGTAGRFDPAGDHLYLEFWCYRNVGVCSQELDGVGLSFLFARDRLPSDVSAFVDKIFVEPPELMPEIALDKFENLASYFQRVEEHVIAKLFNVTPDAFDIF